MTPTVSIIVTCYNHARFLCEAIESVLAQGYPAIELIVVDDGSTDDSAAVAARYPHVTVISQPNAGLAAARNVGLRHSTGELVAFLDADDRLLPNAIEAGVGAAEAEPQAACVVGHYRLIDKGGNLMAEWKRGEVDSDPYMALLRRNHVGMPATVLYRRKTLVKMAGFAVDVAIRGCEDYDLYLRIARHHSIHLHDAVVSEYRQHGSNMSADPLLMLKSAVTVHRRQRPYVWPRPGYWRAYLEGRRFWQKAYGERLIERIVAKSGRAESSGLRAAWTLAVYHPAGFIKSFPVLFRAALSR